MEAPLTVSLLPVNLIPTSFYCRFTVDLTQHQSPLSAFIRNIPPAVFPLPLPHLHILDSLLVRLNTELAEWQSSEGAAL